MAGKTQFFSGRDLGQDSDDGDEFSLFRRDVEDRKARVFSSEHQLFRDPFQNFQFLLCHETASLLII